MFLVCAKPLPSPHLSAVQNVHVSCFYPYEEGALVLFEIGHCVPSYRVYLRTCDV